LYSYAPASTPKHTAEPIRTSCERRIATTLLGVQWFFQRGNPSQHGWYTAALRQGGGANARRILLEDALGFLMDVADEMFHGTS